MAPKPSHPDRSEDKRALVSTSKVSRRSLLRRGVAAAGGASMLGGSAFAGQAAATGTQSPSSSGQRFRAYVRFGAGASVRELKLLPISPRQVVLRSEAAQICYTTT